MIWLRTIRRWFSNQTFWSLIVLCGIVLQPFSSSAGQGWGSQISPQIPDIKPGPPGYYNAPTPPVVSISQAQEILDRRVVAAADLQDKGISNPDQATPEIQALADGLKNDPDLIYAYVHDHIDYTPIFGLVKSPTATLHDGKGNDFDQAALMVALLREAGYTAKYVYGVIGLPTETVARNWLSLPNDGAGSYDVLWAAGVPVEMTWDFEHQISVLDISHVWVKVNLGGTDYVFDPSFKTHTITTGIDLATAMGYNQATFLSAALSGATVLSDTVQNINRSAIRNALSGYAGNLVSDIRTNHPAATLNEIIGGHTIIPITQFPRENVLSYQLTVQAEWSEIPDQYKATLRIQHRGIDQTFFSNDIYGKRLTIFDNAANQAELRLDGALIATGSSDSPGAINTITFSVDHPYAGDDGSFADESDDAQLIAGGKYLILNGWGETGAGMVEKHRQELRKNVFAGGAITSEPVLGESLAMMAYSYLAEGCQTDALASQIGKTSVIHYHIIGIAGQLATPYFDIPLTFSKFISNQFHSEREGAFLFNSAGVSSAFEWGIIDQLQPISAVSTVKLIDLAVQNSNKIFEATSANFSSNIEPQLVNYYSFEIYAIENWLNAGYHVILPQDGALTEQHWTGAGWIVINASRTSIFNQIAGMLGGGYGTEPWTLGGIDTDAQLNDARHDKT